MKRTLNLSVLLLIIMSILAACGGGTTTSNGQTSTSATSSSGSSNATSAPAVATSSAATQSAATTSSTAATSAATSGASSAATAARTSAATTAAGSTAAATMAAATTTGSTASGTSAAGTAAAGSAATAAGGAAASNGGAMQGTGNNCQTTAKKVDKLTMWTKAAQDSPEWPALQQAAKDYTTATGTPVDIVTVPDADFKSKMSVSAPAGEGPDIYGPVANDWIGEFAIQKIAMEVPDSAIKEKQDILPVAIDASTVNGKLYALPLFVESVALIYNKDMVPTPPKTWDELVKTATSLTKGDTYGFGFPLLEQYHEGAFFNGMGSYVFKYQNGKFDTTDIGLNNEAGVATAKFLRDMFHKKQPPLPDVAIDRANMHSVQEGMMEAGKLAMTINGPWREDPLQKAKINYGVAMLPTLPNGKAMVPFSGYQVFAASSFSKHQEAALDFISFVTCTKNAVAMASIFNRAPVRLSASNDATLQSKHPNLKIWADQASQAVPLPNIPAMSNVWKPWGDAMDSIIVKNAPDDQVKGILDTAVQQIKDAIKKTGQ